LSEDAPEVENISFEEFLGKAIFYYKYNGRELQGSLLRSLLTVVG